MQHGQKMSQLKKWSFNTWKFNYFIHTLLDTHTALQSRYHLRSRSKNQQQKAQHMINACNLSSGEVETGTFQELPVTRLANP